MIALILTLIFLYGFVESNLNLLMGFAFLVVAILNLVLIIKLVKQLKLAKKYEIVERNLE